VNTSLTESFGIAIIEAACTGLLCVSTDVGAVWEILPPEVQVLAKPTSDSITEGILKAITMLETHSESGPHPTAIGEMYTWTKLVVRTEEIYQQVLNQPKQQPLARLKLIVAQNRESFNMLALVVLICLVVIWLLDIIKPRKSLSKPIRLESIAEPNCQ
jgi:phosphatidylinositol glycan class A protein